MHLPQSAIDSLATAELLYKKYASAGYAEKGFDYSCISSLYYQAFEDGYNKLIWREYANWLNNEVKIDGHNFTEILFDHKDDDDLGNPKAKGYLGRTAKSRRYYVDYYNDEHIASVKTNLMYASFASLMSQVEKGAKQYSKFCGYFARTVGFPNCYVMFEDTHFMEMVSAFAKAVETAANDRNNASHGGSPVSFTQCKKDKLTVLHELESVRECSIGLIQQLLYITRNSPSHAHN